MHSACLRFALKAGGTPEVLKIGITSLNFTKLVTPKTPYHYSTPAKFSKIPNYPNSSFLSPSSFLTLAATASSLPPATFSN